MMFMHFFPPSLVPSNTYSLPICSYFRYSLNPLRNRKLLHFHKGLKKLDSSKKRQRSNSINEVKAANNTRIAFLLVLRLLDFRNYCIKLSNKGKVRG